MRIASCPIGVTVLACTFGIVGTAAAIQPDRAPEALVTKLLPQADPTWSPDARFGRAVAIDGDTIVFGAPWEEHSGFTKAGAVYVYTLAGADWLFQQRIIATDPDQYHEFGHAVAISGDTLVIGADRDDALVDDAGAAYVFVRSGDASDDLFGHAVAVDGDTVAVSAPGNDNTSQGDVGAVYVHTRSAGVWTQQQKLIHGDPVLSDLFGISLALEGDSLIAGASWKTVSGVPLAGAAYVFTRSGSSWSQQQKLTAHTGPAMEAFGQSVALHGDIAFIGVPSANLGLGGEGAADVFTRSGGVWFGQARLTAGDPGEDDHFGSSLALDGDTVLLGAYGDDLTSGNETGSAYVFTGAGASWSEQEKLTASGAEGGDRFSWSLALQGDTAFIGAPNDDHDGGTMAGSGYVFERNGTAWGSEKTIVPMDGGDSQGFGSSLAMDGSTLVVGAPWDDHSGFTYAGSVSVFVQDGSRWTLQQRLFPSVPEQNSGFGWSLDVSGDTIVVGSSTDDHSGVDDAGSVYVFQRNQGLWVEQQRLTIQSSVPAWGEYFGSGVAIDLDTIVVGIPGFETAGVPVGKLEVFVRSGSTWMLQDVLVNPLGEEQQLGEFVSVSGNTTVASGYPGGFGTPRAFVFTRTSTSWDAGVELPSGGDEGFGRQVSIDVDRLVVSAPGSKAARVFMKSGASWEFEDRLTPTYTSSNIDFGSTSISILGDRVMVSGNSGYPEGGHAYVFHRSGSSWTETLMFSAPPVLPEDGFGRSVAQTSDTVAIGAPSHQFGNWTGAGAVFVYEGLFEADLEIIKTDGTPTASPGGQTTYIIDASNPTGPGDANGATVFDLFPGELSCTWTCLSSGGAACTAGPVAGPINDAVDLPVGGSVSYAAVCDIDPGATGFLVNTSVITLPTGMTDPDLANNTDSDVDTLVAGDLIFADGFETGDTGAWN
jgi:uncharacterized repeat protein (TIGR01451 family)